MSEGVVKNFGPMGYYFRVIRKACPLCHCVCVYLSVCWWACVLWVRCCKGWRESHGNLLKKNHLWALPGPRHLVSSRRWKAGCHTFIQREVASLVHLLATAPGGSPTLDPPPNLFTPFPFSLCVRSPDRDLQLHSFPATSLFPWAIPPSCNQMVSPEVGQLELQRLFMDLERWD